MSRSHDKREGIAAKLVAEGNGEYIELMDFVLAKLDEAERILEEVATRFVEEVEAAETPEILEFLGGGLMTLKSFCAAMSLTAHSAENLAVDKYQEVMLNDPASLADRISSLMGIDLSEASELTDALISAISNPSDNEALDKIREATDDLNGISSEKKEKEKKDAKKDDYWNFSTT